MPQISYDERLDEQLENLVPDRYCGQKRASMRVEYVIEQWLLSKGIQPATLDLDKNLPPAPRKEAAR